MSVFLDRLAEPGPIILDGATGTELERRGVDTSTPIWSAMALLETPEIVEGVHRDYLTAGAEVVLTNTFRTQQRALDKMGIGEETARLTTLAVSIAQKAVKESGARAFVAGSMGPLGDSYQPTDEVEKTYLREHGEMANNLTAAGVDLLMVETMNSVKEAQAAAKAASQTELPFGVSFVCDLDGKLLSGESLGDAAVAVRVWGPSYLGINCTPALAISKALGELKAASELPLAVYANAEHTGDFETWERSETSEPSAYARCAADWLAMGAKMVGGCCGTTPAHIAALSTPLQDEV